MYQSPLHPYGWTDELSVAFAALDLTNPTTAPAVPGRVIFQGRGVWRVVVGGSQVQPPDSAPPTDPEALSEHWAKPAGRVTREEDWPVTGDWVAVANTGEQTHILGVLPRRTAIKRKVAGVTTVAQVIAANVDVVFIASSLDGDLNPRRLERYLALVWESGAEPVIVLTKADACDEAFLERAVAEVGAVAFGATVHVVSSAAREGIDELRAHFLPHRSVAVIGSSGIGKSTLVNALAGDEVMATAGLRADGRGKHTTTHRELVLLPGGGLILDTPGMRELQLWASDEGLVATFPDVEELAATCRFSDCGHGSEPGCAIRDALVDGTLARDRYESWQKLEREVHHLAMRQDARLAADERKKWKRIAKDVKGRIRP